MLLSKLVLEQQVEGSSESIGDYPTNNLELKPLKVDFIVLHLLQIVLKEKLRLWHYSQFQSPETLFLIA